MKKLKILPILLCLCCLLLCACKQKSFAYQTLSTDHYHTGGNLTFVYDEVSHTAYFGGESEVVQFYQPDVAKGWKEEGNRIGFMVKVPNEINDLKSITAELNGDKLTSEDFLSTSDFMDNLNASYLIFQPIVDENNSYFTLEISWKEGYQKQTYNIVIKKGTLFMKK